ncbi:MAG: tRNA (adenosine(37)-N6)-threonylcarbamoyltransferase complex dimerization subunit type 1 TsaB [bacterium]|nr:tRNA (adenosine(37)-N6)-threonylcarbamoyltransferase complex dimerization subunit type 1 TsaB [bacterium]
MTLIIGIETATEICSVAIGLNGKCIAKINHPQPNAHASHLHAMVKEILQENKYTLAQLDAIAVSIGPGSYTGLRVGVSAAKGFAYALKIPVIAINTLHSLAAHFLHQFPNNESLLVPFIDARRMEVYSAVFDSNLQFLEETKAKIINENALSEWLNQNKIAVFGNGAEKCMNVIKHPNATYYPEIHCDSEGLLGLAQIAFDQNKFADLAYFEPYYLKDFVGTTPKKLK